MVVFPLLSTVRPCVFFISILARLASASRDCTVPSSAILAGGVRLDGRSHAHVRRVQDLEGSGGRALVEESARETENGSCASSLGIS
jgi:hypothetical protein